MWHQRANSSSGHYTCTFKVNVKWFIASDSFSDISAYNVPYIHVNTK